jgi:hypothetical protein
MSGGRASLQKVIKLEATHCESPAFAYSSKGPPSKTRCHCSCYTCPFPGQCQELWKFYKGVAHSAIRYRLMYLAHMCCLLYAPTHASGLGINLSLMWLPACLWMQHCYVRTEHQHLVVCMPMSASGVWQCYIILAQGRPVSFSWLLSALSTTRKLPHCEVQCTPLCHSN